LDYSGFAALAIALTMAFFGIQGLVPEIRAAQGQGKLGSFIAQDVECSRSSCHWNGIFRSQDGTATKPDAWLYGQDVDDLAAGEQVPALDSGDDTKVYVPGSNDLIGLLGFFVLTVIVSGFGLAFLQAGRSERRRARGAAP
jgi:hypothetical protein